MHYHEGLEVVSPPSDLEPVPVYDQHFSAENKPSAESSLIVDDSKVSFRDK